MHFCLAKLEICPDSDGHLAFSPVFVYIQGSSADLFSSAVSIIDDSASGFFESLGPGIRGRIMFTSICYEAKSDSESPQALRTSISLAHRPFADASSLKSTKRTFFRHWFN